MFKNLLCGSGAVRAAVLALTGVSLSGCVTNIPSQRVAPDEVPVPLGPPVRSNLTPMEGVFACFADHIATQGRSPVVIGVGDVKDYTGKYSINEGNAITQGGALMVYSALGKLSGALKIAERFDPLITERELGYADRRQLGDGELHEIAGPNGTAQAVPWLPYYGGSIARSDYFIVGGITELNYNIRSGGAQIAVDQIGGKARTFTESVSVDLRIVDTRNLMVVKTVSLTKQFNGYEVGLNTFRFFGSDLFDINLGAKGQEPMQLGIRTALEEGVVELVSAVTNVDYKPCMNQLVGYHIATTPAADLRKVANPAQQASASAAAAISPGARAVNEVSSAAIASGASGPHIAFDFGSATLNGAALGALDTVAAAARKAPQTILLVARDTENWDPGKRDALTDQRIAAVTAALASRGIAPAAVEIYWRPDPADTSIHHDGPGHQEIAKIRIGA